MTPRNNENSPTLSSEQLNSEDTDTNKNPIGIIGAGMVAVAGLFVAGMVYKARRAKQGDTVVAELPHEESFAANSFPIPVPADALSASTSEQESSDSSSERDVTLVG